MELTPEQLRDVHDMASHTIAESELPRVVRERDALLEVVREFVTLTEMDGDAGRISPFGTEFRLRRLHAVIAICEQPKPEPQPCPTPPTDHRPKS